MIVTYMEHYMLKEETEKNIERVVGKSMSEIKNMTVEEEISYIEQKNGKH